MLASLLYLPRSEGWAANIFIVCPGSYRLNNTIKNTDNVMFCPWYWCTDEIQSEIYVMKTLHGNFTWIRLEVCRQAELIQSVSWWQSWHTVPEKCISSGVSGSFSLSLSVRRQSVWAGPPCRDTMKPRHPCHPADWQLCLSSPPPPPP